MNYPKAFEGAIAAVIVENNQLSELPRLRTWQALDSDSRWSPSADRVPPMYDIRGFPPVTDEEAGLTQTCAVQILVGTHAESDQDHTQLAELYDGLERVLAALYSQFINDTTTGLAWQARLSFNNYLSDHEPDLNAVTRIGGFSHGQGIFPWEEGGMEFIGVLFNVHYSRSDY